METQKLILEYVYDHETQRPDQVLLTQPVGGREVIDYTWRQTLNEARRMATHLQSCKFPPGARIAILAKNSAHFIMAELAIWMAGGTTVAIFPTENAETIRYVLDHSEASLLFVGKLDIWPEQRAAIPDGLPCVALPLAPDTGFETWEAIVQRTEPKAGRPDRSAADIAMLLYTSGSTGQPKGVMQSFGTVTGAVSAILSDFRKEIGDEFLQRMLSYLPLSHAVERAFIECAALVYGGTHIYFSESLATFMTDLQRARPTFFVSVPRLWMKFQQGVHEKISAKKLAWLLNIPLVGGIVAKSVLNGMGLDKVLLAGSGTAPIPPEVLLWYRRLGLNLLEAYGMTEDFTCSHASRVTANAVGHVGVPYSSVQVRLDDDGEVLIKSPGTMVGYYKEPGLTADSFTADGFFRTGDLGKHNANGLLQIIGRKKELFKTAKGKYVAPAPIENRLNAHPMVELSMVAGAGQPAAFAIVVPAENLRLHLGNKDSRDLLEAELGRLLHDINVSLAKHERLDRLVVAREPWSIANGCLTPTMKIKRRHIESAAAAKIDEWYAASGCVVWE
jgi:long-subunit acyl-CoA synthetase (AMP-forming)